MQVITEDGVELQVWVEGPVAGPPILLLHSIGCDHAMWRGQAEALAGRRVISPDLRGHGASGAPAGEYGLDRLARDVVAILDALKVERAVVCGLSLGGLIALEMALRAPGRVLGLVLANTSARIGSRDAWADRARVVLDEGVAAIADLAMTRFFSDAFRGAAPTTVSMFRERLLATPADGYAGCCAALRDADLRGEGGAIACPSLVIGGRLDVSTPPEQTLALADDIAGARYVELNAAHLSNVEQPAAFNAALLRYLEEF
jgi:3-oxoadipate enol-lactonase